MLVRTGLDLLLSDRLELLSGKRVGLLVNPTSVDSHLQHSLDLFHSHPDVDLCMSMGPQHGARGETQDNMIEWEDYRDPLTGLPVFSLYGETRVPTQQMLQPVDVVVFDMQDIGARYYTFIYTMALAMKACSRAGVEFILLDRPNPINGVSLEGPVLDPGFSSFVGLYPLPIRHGMTVGELALYFNQRFSLGCNLTVVPVQGWDREMFYDDCGLNWVLPSPNIPTLNSAEVYPGMCLLEGTNVSEGRGTTRPFEVSGAPWVEAREMVERVEAFGLAGVAARPMNFIPTFHKWSGELLGGVQLHVTDRQVFEPFRAALALLMVYRELGGDQFRWLDPPYEYEYEKLPFDILCGTDTIRTMIEAGAALEAVVASWQQELDAFKEVREKYLLY